MKTGVGLKGNLLRALYWDISLGPDKILYRPWHGQPDQNKALVSFKLCKLGAGMKGQRLGWRLWVYLKSGSMHFDVYLWRQR